MPRRKQLKKLTDNAEYSLPLRREVHAVLHFAGAHGEQLRTALDVGFDNASVSRVFRTLGGCWVTMGELGTPVTVLAEALGAESVFEFSREGTLPFAEKQFDIVALAHGVLADSTQAPTITKECHRVLKDGGVLIFTVEYRKRLSLAALFNRKANGGERGGAYTEYAVFQLLKHGFDVLGFRFSCRFWVQMVRQWAAKRTQSGARGANNMWLKVLYALALMCDLPLIWSRGHLMTVCARRKGWRGKPAHVLSESTPVSDAMLFNPGQNSKKFHAKQSQ